MVRNIFAAMIIAFCVQTAFAQSTNPKRTVLYTFALGEYFRYNEYTVEIQLGLDAYKFALITDNKQTGKQKFIFNGKVITEADDIGVVHFNFTSDKGYAFSYSKNGEMYVNIKGQIDGPFEWVSNLQCGWGYSYQLAGRTYEKNEGYESLWGEHRRYGNKEIDITSYDQNHTFYSSIEYEYVVVGGKRVGHSPALHAWWDEKKNAFIWTSMEKQELVLYEYKLQ